MKHMQDFREWLFAVNAVNAASTPHQRRLAALTRLDRAQLSNASNELAWFIWEAGQPACAS